MADGIHFQYPWALMLLAFIPALFWLRKKRSVSIGFSSVPLIPSSARPPWWQHHLVDLFGIGFLILSILSIANLRYAVQFDRHYLASKWIMIVQDLSGSMNRPSGAETGQTLGDVSLEGVEAFIGLRHPRDLIGLIAFSSHARLVAPPTFDRRILAERVALLRRERDSAIFREMTAGGATNASYAAWLALCTFFMLMPENRRPAYPELQTLRHSLSGPAMPRVDLPAALSGTNPGGGMAIVLFTDGRIEAGDGADNVQKGLPNFVNVVRLLGKIGIHLYIIVVGETVDPEIRDAMGTGHGERDVGLIFHMPHRFDSRTITEAYETIHRLEPNRWLYERVRREKETRKGLAAGAVLCLVVCGALMPSRRFGRI